MAPGSCAWQSSCNNPPTNPTREQDELASPQGLAGRSDASSNEAFTPIEASTPLFIPPTKDLFTKFMKAFVESTQIWEREQAEPREQLLKVRSPETYSRKSHIDCYHFCQQCEDHFETSGTTRMNRTSFVASFFYGTISLRWAQHRHHH